MEIEQDNAISCLDDLFGGENSSEEKSISISPPKLYEGLWLCSWSEQWFSFELQQGYGLLAKLQYNAEDGPLDLKLYEEDHNGLTDFVASTREHYDGADLVYNNSKGGLHYLRVHGRGDEISFGLSVQINAEGFGEENDLCSGAKKISINTDVVDSTAGRYDDYHSSCSESFGPDVVYWLETEFNGGIEVSLEGEYDFVVSLRKNCLDPATEKLCIDKYGASNTETLEISNLEAGRYYLLVDGHRWRDQGNFRLRWERK